ncbi:MAG: hypothetical protein KAT61_02385 [Gammaproteobacteria bacterium]|nr:hypothetical protein [Gammaproteobacteria bacterium]
MKLLFQIISLLFTLLMNNIAAAQNTGPLTGLSALSESDIRNSAIAFVNTTSSPGLEGATISVDSAQRSSNQWRSSLGFNAEITLKDHIFNGYWGLGLVGGSLDDRIQLTADNDQAVKLDMTRDIISLRGTAGLSFPINQHFKLLPVLTLTISDVRTRSIIDGLLDSNNGPTILSFDNSVQMVSSTGSINALYWHWYDNYKLELSAHFNQIYTDAVSEDNPILDTHVWHQTSQLKSRISGPTSLTTKARPWRWQAYVNHTKFISQNKRALGYTGLFEIGTGLEWQLNVKPLDWFGWQYIGFSAGLITSRNVEGFNVGLTAR